MPLGARSVSVRFGTDRERPLVVGCSLLATRCFARHVAVHAARKQPFKPRYLVLETASADERALAKPWCHDFRQDRPALKGARGPAPPPRLPKTAQSVA